MWLPLEEDLSCVSHWLLYTPVGSCENQLARLVLGQLNWDYDGTQLMLPRELHYKVGLTVVESHMKVTREIAQSSYIAGGVTQVTAVMYSPSPQQIFLSWSWEILCHLHLHHLDQPDAQIQQFLDSG
ncbi:unnamed protein product, partial [Meganyctiphanes norvegica]